MERPAPTIADVSMRGNLTAMITYGITWPVSAREVVSPVIAAAITINTCLGDIFIYPMQVDTTMTAASKNTRKNILMVRFAFASFFCIY
jgi:hypothetical protein